MSRKNAELVEGWSTLSEGDWIGDSSQWLVVSVEKRKPHHHVKVTREGGCKDGEPDLLLSLSSRQGRLIVVQLSGDDSGAEWDPSV